MTHMETTCTFLPKSCRHRVQTHPWMSTCGSIKTKEKWAVHAHRHRIVNQNLEQHRLWKTEQKAGRVMTYTETACATEPKSIGGRAVQKNEFRVTRSRNCIRKHYITSNLHTMSTLSLALQVWHLIIIVFTAYCAPWLDSLATWIPELDAYTSLSPLTCYLEYA